ncbi:MAG TPA: TOBE domain-containing protein [Solirubrobacteraceae bacterium]|jgi:multiple sugar transport system ATP-binding protein|nr:TOBE domain-containing protein [Solirubrobacteraceae bacterium]
MVGLRPESFEIDGDGGINAEVEVVEELGADAYAFCNAHTGDGDTKLIARTDWRHPPEPGTRVRLSPTPAEAHVFDPATGERLGS